jgi:type II secretory pathway predicted ATPase ExeA
LSSKKTKLSPFSKHFEARKEILEAWIKNMGFKRNPFLGFTLPNPDLLVEMPEFLGSLVDIVVSNERPAIFLRGPVGVGKSTHLILIRRDIRDLKDLNGNTFRTAYIDRSGLHARQFARLCAIGFNVKFGKTEDSDEIMDSVGKDIIEKYTKEKIRSVLLAEDISENQHEIFSKLQYLADLHAEFTEEPIATIIMTGTSEYFQALAAVLPQIADRCEPIDVPRFEWKHAREFIGRRIAYAKGEISYFDEENFTINPFDEDAAKILFENSQGIPRDLRLLCRAAVSVSAEAFANKDNKGEITVEIARVVSEYYKKFLTEI